MEEQVFYRAGAVAPGADGGIKATLWVFGEADHYGDRILPGAVRDMPAGMPMLWSHDPAEVIGRWARIWSDDKGMYAEGRITDSARRGAEVRALVEEGAISGVSIGFTLDRAAAGDAVKHGPDGLEFRAIRLHEASVVAIPAHPGAKISRALDPVQARAHSLARAAIARGITTIEEPKMTTTNGTGAETAPGHQALAQQVAEIQAAQEASFKRMDIIEQTYQMPASPGIYGEAAEIAGLISRASMGDALRAAYDGRPAGGALAELQAARGLPEGGRWLPWDMLTRAVTPGLQPGTSTAPQDAAPVLDRVFARGDLDFIGAQMQTAPVGTVSLPVLSTGATVNKVAVDADLPNAAAGLTAQIAKPERIGSQLTIRVEEIATHMDLEGAILRELSGAIMEAVEADAFAQIFKASSASPRIAAPTTATTTLGYSAGMDLALQLCDGRYAGTLADTRILLGPDSAKFALSIVGANRAAWENLLTWYANETSGWRASAHVPAPASNVQEGLLISGMGTPGQPAAWMPHGGCVLTTWNGFALEVDRSSQPIARAGHAVFTAYTMAAFTIRRPAEYARVSLKIA